MLWKVIPAVLDLEGGHFLLADNAGGTHWPCPIQRGVLSIRAINRGSGAVPRHDDNHPRNGDYSDASQGDDSENCDYVAQPRSFGDHALLVDFFVLIPSVHAILFPCCLSDQDRRAMRCTLDVGGLREMDAPAAICPVVPPSLRCYTTVEAIGRLARPSSASRCSAPTIDVAGSRGRRSRTCSGTHIISRVEHGSSVVIKAFWLPSLRYCACDRSRLGIDADGCMQMAGASGDKVDGLKLEQAIKPFHGHQIRLPGHMEDRPSRDDPAEPLEILREVTS